MKILALETSSRVGSIALLDGTAVTERLIASPREQTDLVLPLVDELLADAGLALRDLDAIAFGRGPGSFTGLRIAAAVAQGLALSAGLEVAAVSSLEALAQRAWRELGIDDALILVDARMREVYLAHYVVRDGRAERIGDERLVAPEAVEAPKAAAGAPAARWSAVGDGWAAYADELAPVLAGSRRVAAELVPSARDVLVRAAADVARGRLLAPEAALPTYLRDEGAWRR
ncbi:MAG TPA: tRNA (adenosine(37)-N6)-threonylcarbamoyltransferase complex dimerization subunit type 1 TsaB [Gammaproteobacteria bacterium]